MPRPSLERLLLAEASSGVGTFEFDLASGQWRLSPYAAVLFGFTPQSAPDSFAEWERNIVAVDVPKLHAAETAAKNTGRYHVEFRVRDPDSSIRWLAGKGSVAGDRANSAPCLFGAYFDITDQKASDARLVNANETLAAHVTDRDRRLDESLSRFHLLVDAVTDYAIFMLDPTGHIVSWNTGAERIKGYTHDEIVGRHFSIFYTAEDRQAELPRRALAAASASGRFSGEGWRVRKGGVRFWASVVINTVYDQNGAVLGFAKVTRDLTERKAAEERMQQAQKLEALGQLTGGVAHDFNNMLLVISGNINAWERHLPRDADPVLRRLSSMAMHGVERASILIQRLLAFSRRQPLEPAAVSVHELTTRLADMLRRTLGETILIETMIPARTWPIFVDPNQLENALLNLAINARDAMPDGGRLTIEAMNLNCAEADDVTAGPYVCIAVSDTGTGMTPEIAARAFEPFFSTKETGHGTGLGLPQVYGFVKQSGGHVRLYSEVGGGTSVKVFLPRYLDGLAAAADAADEVGHAPHGHGETILVVEDDRDVRGLTVEALHDLGYVVIDAADGRSGLRQLEANRDVRLLFTDVGLPGGMNGRQLADEAKRRYPDLKILFTSGYARHAIVHHGRLDPGVELITKPFTFDALATKLRRVLSET